MITRFGAILEVAGGKKYVGWDVIPVVFAKICIIFKDTKIQKLWFYIVKISILFWYNCESQNWAKTMQYTSQLLGDAYNDHSVQFIECNCLKICVLATVFPSNLPPIIYSNVIRVLNFFVIQNLIIIDDTVILLCAFNMHNWPWLPQGSILNVLCTIFSPNGRVKRKHYQKFPKYTLFF